MKYFIKIAYITLISLALLLQGKMTRAQKTDKSKLLSEKIEKKDFVFVANSASPLRGRQKILTDLYDVRVSGDSIISFLPYFGQSTQAPMNSSESGIQFTSTSFDYSFEPGKKKSWDVNIKFKDQKNTDRFSFIIYDNGEASLNVTSIFRDPITFRGYIKM